ncbi:MAG: uracil phosphoribosyltransferase [Clostridiales bacterium]|nr:uracil phosphoribosyltransferase [Clostridiales bacterium]
MNYKGNDKIHILEHPLISHKLAILRDEHTGTREFRAVVAEIASLITYEATRRLPTKEVEVTTPCGVAKCQVLTGKKLAIVPILRAGLGMVDGVLSLLPSAKVGHVGLYRDPETLEPVEYYCKMPADIAERDVIILDPMLATGGSATAAIQFMKDYGCQNIAMMNIIAAPEGLDVIAHDHSDVEIYVAALDDHLNEHGYIVPGLGDAGDRIFGTK